jgi:CHAT domain-containing protein
MKYNNNLCSYLILIVTILLLPLDKNTLANTVEVRSENFFNISENSNPSLLLERGKLAYDQGKYNDAIYIWQELLTLYENQGSNQQLNQAQVLNYLSLGYQALGEWKNSQDSLEKSLNILQKLDNLDFIGKGILAQNFNSQGSLYLEMGKTQEALEKWVKSEKYYQEINNQSGIFGSRLNQAQALQNLGQYRRSKSILENLVKELNDQPDTLLKANILRSLGIALQTVGDQQQSKFVLDQSRNIADQLNNNEELSATLFSIGNIAMDIQQYDVAIEYYTEAINKTENSTKKLQAQLNLFRVLVEIKQWQKAQIILPEILNNFDSLPLSRQTIYGRVNLAESLIKIHQNQQKWIDLSAISNLLVIAINQSRILRDSRAEAYSLNQLAKLYEEQKQWQEAQNLTQQTLKISQSINSADLSALASWRLGRIYAQQGNLIEAIASYDLAFNKIQSLRKDLVAVNPEIQFDFKENVEPLYREYVNLLLTYNSRINNNKNNSSYSSIQKNLKKALDVIEALQLAELDNFFRDACLDTKPVSLDQIDTKAGLIYPIILSDRLEVILSLPNQPLEHYSVELTQTEIENTLKQFYSSLYVGYSKEERLKKSQTIYNWLIKPAETKLENSKIETLVFVLDGFLRNLPMGALHDGEKYLIEKYSLALSPGLQLFPQGLPQQNISALTVGLTEARQGFNELPGVKQEINQISQQINSQVLLNQGFTTESFTSKMGEESFQVVHLATHGQFSSNPDETFLLTWDGKIKIQDFEKLFEKRRFGILEPIELLVLSACQTASGDSRATLGLAGLSLSSGAKSTLASLWSVNDQSTADLMGEFYHQLSQRDRFLTKAEALRQAQLSLLRNPLYDHPYYWASFVLIGNWL